MEEVGEKVMAIDAAVDVLDCQVAGHSFKRGKPSEFLSHKDGYVLKPVFKDEEQGRREIEFYEQLQDTCDPVVQELKKFVPDYYGTTRLNNERSDAKWIVLKNIIHEFKEPCIMDVKVGARTWDPLATEEKRLSEEAKYRDCKRDLGFCIPGFQVYKLSTGELVRKDRNFGKSLNGKTAKNAIKMFLNGENGLSRGLLLQFLGKLWKILGWFRTQTRYNFYSSSLLLAYDAAKLKQVVNGSGRAGGKPQALGRQVSLRASQGHGPGPSGGLPFDNVCKTHSLDNNYDKDLEMMRENYEVVLRDLVDRSEEQNEMWVNVNMIDFAHVFNSDNEGVDSNYLRGLQSLVNIFEEYLVEAAF